MEGQTDKNEMSSTYKVIDEYLKLEGILGKDHLIIERLHVHSGYKCHLAAAHPKF